MLGAAAAAAAADSDHGQGNQRRIFPFVAMAAMGTLCSVFLVLPLELILTERLGPSLILFHQTRRGFRDRPTD